MIDKQGFWVGVGVSGESESVNFNSDNFYPDSEGLRQSVDISNIRTLCLLFLFLTCMILAPCNYVRKPA